jgi:hypothetical protein
MDRSITWNVVKLALVGAGAVVTGYAVVGLLSELVQEVWLGGVSYRHSSLGVLILAGIFTPAGGVVGGIVAGAIGRRAPLAHGLALGAVIAAETTYLFTTHRVDGPLWFEAGAGATLAAAAALGSWLAGRWPWSSAGKLSP